MKKLFAAVLCAALSASTVASDTLLSATDNMRDIEESPNIFQDDDHTGVLPPHIQNIKDVEVMLDFLKLKKNESIANGLKSINVEKQMIHYGGNCMAIFKRKHQNVCHDKHFAGPAGKLVFDHITCTNQEDTE